MNGEIQTIMETQDQKHWSKKEDIILSTILVFKFYIFGLCFSSFSELFNVIRPLEPS